MPRIPISRAKLTALALAAIALLSALGLLQGGNSAAPAPPPVTTPALTPAPTDNPAAPGRPGALPASADELPGVTEFMERLLEAANRHVTAGTYDTSGVLSGATAQPAQIKCPTPMNGGTRSISSIKLGVIHVTVSRNVAGLADGNALCTFFRNVKASPTWTVDNEGNSWENVALDRVPWTQAWYNRASCSIEFVGSTGRPGEGAAEWTDVQLREGARLMAQCFVKAGIKAMRGAVTTAGEILKAGVVTHQELGAKGGGHVDPGPAFKMASFMKYLAASMNPTTAVDRVTCRKLNYWRNHGRKPGKGLANAIRRRDALTARGVRCLSTGPVRA